ncbi:MAG: HDOD domain-containing protein [Candidatus Marinimicrobia bacterium]|nr:HDOD domain-containing protein [Candidatus Neomarinimicrobiota bacterium]
MEVFVARQPIFNRRFNVHAYELLFRSGLQNYVDFDDGDRATLDVIRNSFFYIGLEELTDHKQVFVNFTSNLLLKGVPTLFPSNVMIIEILENVEPTKEILDACKALKQSGYTLALDDFILSDKKNPLIEFADIIKVDFRESTNAQQDAILDLGRTHRIKFLAEKVETSKEFKRAREAGYAFFQGYFFSKPVIRSGRSIPAFKLNYMKMLQEVNRADVDFSDMERIIKRDLAMTYKLMRFINSAYFGVLEQVNSIKRALVLLGIDEIKKWISFIALDNMAQDKPNELIKTSVVRARLCENIAMQVGLDDYAAEAFLMGMFTVIDAIMDKPMREILPQLALADEIKNALTGKENRFKHILDLVLAYERGEWDDFSRLSEITDFSESEMPKIYNDGLKWTEQIFEVKNTAVS